MDLVTQEADDGRKRLSRTALNLANEQTRENRGRLSDGGVLFFFWGCNPGKPALFWEPLRPRVEDGTTRGLGPPRHYCPPHIWIRSGLGGGRPQGVGVCAGLLGESLQNIKRHWEKGGSWGVMVVGGGLKSSVFGLFFSDCEASSLRQTDRRRDGWTGRRLVIEHSKQDVEAKKNPQMC